MGANSFRLISFNRVDEKNSSELTLETYFANDSIVKQSEASKRGNIVYLFAQERKSPGETTTLAVNGEKIELDGGKYLMYELKEGERLKVSKGGIMGTTIWFEWEEGKHARYMSLSGFGVGVTQPGTVGLSFNSGKISPMNRYFGELLTHILERAN
jgi:hypothetical protein